MNDEKLTESPGLPAGETANAGLIHGGENLVNALPIDWGEPQPVSAEQQAQRETEWTDIKVRVKDADPKTLTRAEKFARTVARKEEAQVAQRKDAGGATEQAPVVARPSRKRAAKVAATADEVQPDAAKATRTRKKAAQGAAVVPAQGLSAPGAAPAAGAAPTADDAIPPIAPEAISFLGKQDVTAADVLKLDPDSLTFVQHHFNFLRRIEPDSQANKAYVMASTFADALLKSRSDLSPDKEPPAVSYGPKAAAIAAYAPVAVQFGNPEFVAGSAEWQKRSSEAVLEDTKRAHKVWGMPSILQWTSINFLIDLDAADLTAAAAKEVRAINKDEEARQRAQYAMAESSSAQLCYSAEFMRQAPELIDPAHASYKAVRAHQELLVNEEQGPENSIERSPVQLVSNEQKPAQSAAGVGKVALTAEPRPSLGKRLMLVLGGVALNAGTWLSDRGREGRAAPAAQATPAAPATTVSLTKQEPVAPTVAPADDKSTIVPNAVARRFLKVEQEYYFADRTHAFSDRGQKLATRGADPEVIRSLVEIAKARGWDTITVKGADDFRRSAWMEAAQNGLKVAGYQPTALDLAELANRPAKNTVEKGVVKEKVAAPAQPQAAAQAAEASPIRPTVALQGAAALAVEASKPDPELAEKARVFAENKPSFVVKKYPDLAGAYGVVEAAKAFAAEKLPEAARDEFVGMARRHVMQKIITGEPVKGPKIYVAQAKDCEPPQTCITASVRP